MQAVNAIETDKQQLVISRVGFIRVLVQAKQKWLELRNFIWCLDFLTEPAH